MTNQIKKCSQCGEEKPFEQFYKDKQKSDGYRPECKECTSKRQKKYNEKNRENISNNCKKYYQEHKEEHYLQHKEYYAKNREKILAYHQEYYEENKEKIQEYKKEYAIKNADELKEKARKYRETHKDEIAKQHRIYREQNQEKIKAYLKQWHEEHKEEQNQKNSEYRKQNREKINLYFRQRKETDVLFAFSSRIRRLVYRSLVETKGFKKDSSSAEILGCTFEEAWSYLLDTWKENYGTEWNGEEYHIDHIIPLSIAQTEDEVKQLCHISNLQMLTPQDNFAKRDKIGWKTQYRLTQEQLQNENNT